MKLHDGPAQMPHDEELITALRKLLKGNPKVKTVVETGTFHGLGSTQVIIKAIEGIAESNLKYVRPKVFTIEVNEDAFLVARNNLREYDYVTVLHGCSLEPEEAREFIMNDKAILEHEKYPDIYIDDLVDPVKFYLEEIRGKHFNYGYGGKDNILLRLMPDIARDNPLFVLDSAGGMGYLEFTKVVEYMGDRRYNVLLDDVTHLKHFRSAAYVKHCNWPILFENGRCILVTHPGTPGKTKKKK